MAARARRPVKALAKKNKASGKKSASPKKARKASTADHVGEEVPTGYSQREYLVWMEKWKTPKGLPQSVIAGKTRDGRYGVAILHEDDAGNIWVSHVCYHQKSLRDGFVRGLRFMFESA